MTMCTACVVNATQSHSMYVPIKFILVFCQTASPAFTRANISVDERLSAFCNQSIFQHKEFKKLLEMFLCVCV